MERAVNEGSERMGLSEEEIGELLQSITEMYDEKELKNDRLMMRELRYFLGLKEKDLRALLEGARELSKLRGRRIPLWALCYQNH